MYFSDGALLLMFLFGAVKLYHQFPRFWDQLYGLFRLGLSTEVHLRSCFHILLNWRILRVRTGFCTSILSPVFWAGLSQITRFWTYRISAVVPGFQGRVNDYGWKLEPDKKLTKISWHKYFSAKFSKLVRASGKQAQQTKNQKANSTKIKVMWVTGYNLTLDLPLLIDSRAELHL